MIVNWRVDIISEEDLFDRKPLPQPPSTPKPDQPSAPSAPSAPGSGGSQNGSQLSQQFLESTLGPGLDFIVALIDKLNKFFKSMSAQSQIFGTTAQSWLDTVAKLQTYLAKPQAVGVMVAIAVAGLLLYFLPMKTKVAAIPIAAVCGYLAALGMEYIYSKV